MSTKWKSWKNMMKFTNYDPTLSVDEMVENEDDKRVNKTQLKELATLWIKLEYQALCAKKKESCSKNTESHVTESKSFARLAEEEAAKNNSVRLTRGQLYIKSRTRKDETVVNASAPAVVDALHNVMNEADDIEEGEGSWKNDALAKVKGPENRGRILCIGKIATVKERSLPLLKTYINKYQIFKPKFQSLHQLSPSF